MALDEIEKYAWYEKVRVMSIFIFLEIVQNVLLHLHSILSIVVQQRVVV